MDNSETIRLLVDDVFSFDRKEIGWAELIARIQNHSLRLEGEDGDKIRSRLLTYMAHIECGVDIDPSSKACNEDLFINYIKSLSPS